MIYLDNAATSFPKPPGVAEAVADHITTCGVTSGRGSYNADVQASRAIFESREKLAALLGIPDSSRIAFTMNATYGINALLKGFLNTGDSVLTTDMEHNAVMRTLNYLAASRNIRIVKTSCSREGYLDLEDFRIKIQKGIKLAVINHASNVTGAVQNIEEIGELCRNAGAALMVDAAQTAGHLPIDTVKMNIDMLAFSGHKGLMGPTGCGAFYARAGIEPEPFVHGGTGSNSSEEFQPEFWPDKMEAGTLNLAPLAGLDHALDFIIQTGINDISEKISGLTQYLISRLKTIPEAILYGPVKIGARTSVVSLNIKGKAPSDVALKMNASDICVRTGLHCAPGAHRRLGTFPDGTVRISPGYFTTELDIDRAVSVLGGL